MSDNLRDALADGFRNMGNPEQCGDDIAHPSVWQAAAWDRYAENVTKLLADFADPEPTDEMVRIVWEHLAGETVTDRKVREALRAALADSATKRLDFDSLLRLAELMLERYPENTIVSSGHPSADVGARFTDSLRRWIQECRRHEAVMVEKP